MTEIETYASQILNAVKSYVEPVRARTAALETRLGALMMILPNQLKNKNHEIADVSNFVAIVEKMQARIDVLEKRTVMTYEGVFCEGATYKKGAMVTHSGGTWYCHEETRDTPSHSSDWQLISKGIRTTR